MFQGLALSAKHSWSQKTTANLKMPREYPIRVPVLGEDDDVLKMPRGPNNRGLGPLIHTLVLGP